MEVTVEMYVIRHKYKTSYSPFHCRISCLNAMSFLLLNSHRLCQVSWAIHIASSTYSNMIWKKLHWNNSQDTLQKKSLDIKNYKLVKHCSLSVIAISCVKAVKQTVVSTEHNLKYKWCKPTKTQAVIKRQNCFNVYDKTVRITEFHTPTNALLYTRWLKSDRDWFVCKQAALRSSCATLRE